MPDLFNIICDNKRDCLDGSDETSCAGLRTEDKSGQDLPNPPVIVNMDARGDLRQFSLGQGAVVCPDTHFRCPG